MATTSEVKTGLDQLSIKLVDARNRAKRDQASMKTTKNILADVPTQFADIFATIDAYAGGNNFEDTAKDAKAKLISEGVTLSNKVSSADTDLDAYDFSV